MSKHRAPHAWPWQEREPARHSAGWTYGREHADIQGRHAPYTPGKHANPFGKHHPATPVTYDAPGRTTPLTPPELVLDAAA